MSENTTLSPATDSLKSEHQNDAPASLSLAAKVATLIVIVLPLLGLLAAIVFLWGHGFHWSELGLLAGMYTLTALGITIGYHRLFTHRSFETNAVVQSILAVLGSMAAQGSVLKWVAMHRRHHQHSDGHDDPHSPHHYGAGVVGMLRGLWHAHLGWFFQPDPPNLFRYVNDLRQSRLVRWISNLMPLWVIAGLLLPTVLGALLVGGWTGALFGLLWGGLVRVFLVHHVTWSVNSVCHLWGRKPFPVLDESRNNFIFGVLAFGEGWHNNHHAFPTSARHGLRWWQFDLSYWIIRGLSCLGLAWNVRVPPLRANGLPAKLEC